MVREVVPPSEKRSPPLDVHVKLPAARCTDIGARARQLKPLGDSRSNGVKFFAASGVLEQAKDRMWLAKVTNALNQHWQKRNAARRRHLTGEAGKVHARAKSMVLA